MSNGSLIGSVADRLGIGQPSVSQQLVAVRVETKGDSLKEIILNGGGHDQLDGVPDIYDGFGIPGIEGIDTPSQLGIKLRTITRIPDELKYVYSPQTGMTIISFGVKAPPVVNVDHKNVLGYWSASGLVLASYVENMRWLAQLGAAIHSRDLAVCLGTNDGKIGCDTLRLIVVSALSDTEREDFLKFDQETVKDRDSLRRRMGHWNGARSTKTDQAKHVPPVERVANDRQSA